MPISRDQILDALRTVHDPELHQSIVDLGMVKEVGELRDGCLPLTIELTTPACPLKNVIQGAVLRALVPLGIETVDVTWASRVRGRDTQSMIRCLRFQHRACDERQGRSGKEHNCDQPGARAPPSGRAGRLAQCPRSTGRAFRR